MDGYGIIPHAYFSSEVLVVLEIYNDIPAPGGMGKEVSYQFA